MNRSTGLTVFGIIFIVMGAMGLIALFFVFSSIGFVNVKLELAQGEALNLVENYRGYPTAIDDPIYNFYREELGKKNIDVRSISSSQLKDEIYERIQLPAEATDHIITQFDILSKEERIKTFLIILFVLIALFQIWSVVQGITLLKVLPWAHTFVKSFAGGLILITLISHIGLLGLDFPYRVAPVIIWFPTFITLAYAGIILWYFSLENVVGEITGTIAGTISEETPPWTEKEGKPSGQVIISGEGPKQMGGEVKGGPAPAVGERPTVPSQPEKIYAWLLEKETGKNHNISKPTIILGRGQNNADIVIDDARVSRIHAKITFSGGSFFIEDMGSMHGTFINGNKIKKSDLRDNDHIGLGPLILVFKKAI